MRAAAGSAGEPGGAPGEGGLEPNGAAGAHRLREWGGAGDVFGAGPLV